MIQFYAPDIELNGELPESESAHCVRVLRKREGDEIIVVDGKGHRYNCEIVKANPSHTSVRILSKESHIDTSDSKVTLAVAPTKNSDRLEWLVEKAVEIGVDKIVLLKCDHSERKVQKPDRLLKIMISAMKQSLGVKLPELIELTDLKEFVKEQVDNCEKYFGYCSEDFPRKEFVKEYQGSKDVRIMIGPEGDFSPEEVETAIEYGYVPVSFGEKRLRTETAGVFALSAVNIINQQKAE